MANVKRVTSPVMDVCLKLDVSKSSHNLFIRAAIKEAGFIDLGQMYWE